MTTTLNDYFYLFQKKSAITQRKQKMFLQVMADEKEY